MATIHRIVRGKTLDVAGPGRFLPDKGCFEVLWARVPAVAVVSSLGNPSGKDFTVTVYRGDIPVKRRFHKAANFYTLNEALAAVRDWVK